MKFDSLELQKNIEEKRLIFGKKIEDFLLKQLKKCGNFISKNIRKFYQQKYFVTFSCLAIILTSIYARSTRDFGHDSCVYLEIAQKIISGGKYYYDFFENNFPLPLYLATIPLIIAKTFAINKIIAFETFINIIGIATIYFCAKILKNEDAQSQQSERQLRRQLRRLTIILFCFVYFIRIYTMQFNEYGTKSSYFLALALIYTSYQIAAPSRKSTQIIIGIIAGLITCLKPNYILFIAGFELYNLSFRQNLFRQIFNLRNLSCLGVVGLYLVLMTKFTPEYFENLSRFASVYFSWDYINYFSTIKEDAFPILLFSALAFNTIKNNHYLKILFLATIFTMPVIASEILGGYDHRFMFFSFAIPLFFSTLFVLIKERKIDWRKNWPIALICLLLPQFDTANSFALILNLCCFWWLILFVQKIFDIKKICLALISIFLLIFDNSGKISWIFCALVSTYLLKININNKFFGRNFIIISSLVLSYLLSLIFAAAFNYQGLVTPSSKSINYVNEQKISLSKKYAPKDSDQIIIIADSIMSSYPVFTYLEKQNALPSSQLTPLYRRNLFDKRPAALEAMDYLFLRLKQQISNKNNKLIFIHENFYFSNGCKISFLEYYFSDTEFKNYFLQNYSFLTTIIDVENSSESSKILSKVEVYIRK